MSKQNFVFTVDARHFQVTSRLHHNKLYTPCAHVRPAKNKADFDNGKVLTATYADGTGSYEWAAPATELPDDTGASTGDVLAIGSDGLEWATFIQLPDYSEASVGDILTITADGPAWVTPEATRTKTASKTK